MFKPTFVAFAILAVINPALALWPRPQNADLGTTALRLSPIFEITTEIFGAPQDLEEAIARTRSYLISDDLGRLVVGRGSSDASAVKSAKTLSKLTLSLKKGAEVKSITEEVQKSLESRDESYALTVPNNGGAATITANTTLGLLRGLTTFGQLWYTYDGIVYSIQTPVKVTDEPAYPYRGLLLDTSRNFFPVDDIKRTLDAMSWVKLSQFHWHISDSQSWPLEVSAYPLLAEKGAYSSSQVYSAQDVADIISYAGARGIDVMPEIDTPGHTDIIGEAYPDYVACHQSTPWADSANEPPAGQLRFAVPEVVTFTTNLLTAVAKQFPSTLFSTGGDELNTNCYANDEPTIAALNSSGQTFEEALSTFTVSTHKALEKIGKTPVVWEEMVLDHNVTLSPQTLVLVWISSDDVKAVAEKGFGIIHSASDYFYLDCGAGGWVGDDPTTNSWCEPFKTWQYSYSFNPTANLTEAESKLVKGGQHLLWTEQSGPQNLDSIVWPRAASSAELFWSGPGGNGSEALPRLHDVSYRFRQRGVNSINLQPEWCALRPQACNINS